MITTTTARPTRIRSAQPDETGPAAREATSSGLGLLFARAFGILVVVAALAAAMGGWLLVLL